MYAPVNKRRKWSRFFRRLLLGAAVALVIAVAPLPVWTPEWFLYWQVPAAVFLFIVYVGKLLIDTIIYPPKR